MAKTKTQAQRQEPQSEPKQRAPLDAFVHHQAKALEESGKAIVSLLPKDFRTHAGSAVDETCASFQALFDGVIDTVEYGLDRLRSKPKEDPGKEKVHVDVE